MKQHAALAAACGAGFLWGAGVLVVNLHGDPMTEYPFFLGHADEKGAGAGEGADNLFDQPFRGRCARGESEGAELLLHGLEVVFPRFKKLWADQAYKPIRDWVATELGWELETVARPVDQAGFVLLPRRWVVERTLAWLSRYRRLSKDYEHEETSSETTVHIASIHILLKKLTA